MTAKPIAAGKSSFDLVDEKKLFNALDIGAEAVILDAACGRGAYTLALVSRWPDITVHAVDLWREGLDMLRQAAAERELANIHVHCADISRKIPIDDQSVNICLAATVLHDLVVDGTDQGALREICRVLKSDGRLAVVEFKKISAPPGPPTAIRLDRRELDALLRPHGFRPHHKEDLGKYLYFALYARSAAA